MCIIVYWLVRLFEFNLVMFFDRNVVGSVFLGLNSFSLSFKGGFRFFKV